MMSGRREGFENHTDRGRASCPTAYRGMADGTSAVCAYFRPKVETYEKERGGDREPLNMPGCMCRSNQYETDLDSIHRRDRRKRLGNASLGLSSIIGIREDIAMKDKSLH